MAKKKAVKKKAVKKKVAKKKVVTSSLSAKLEKTIEKDFQACEELLRSGEGRNEWIEKNCKRLAAWQEAAEAGDARGQVLYGCCFYYGHGVKENHKKAVEWFSKSAEQGNAQGQFSLGQCYFYGHGVEENDKKAVEWFSKSAEQGNAEGQFSLGQCYYHGAVDWFQKAAEQGHWMAIVTSLWFVYWVDVDAVDNHGLDILFGPFATREAAELYISIDHASNQDAVSGNTLLWGDPADLPNLGLLNHYFMFYERDKGEIVYQLTADTHCDHPNGWWPKKSNERSFNMQSIGEVTVIDIVNGKLARSVDGLSASEPGEM